MSTMTIDLAGRTPCLPGMPRRDDVHRFRARCSECGARIWLGPRQRNLLLQSEGDLERLCIGCMTLLAAIRGDTFDMCHLDNPDLELDEWPAGEVRRMRWREAG